MRGRRSPKGEGSTGGSHLNRGSTDSNLGTGSSRRTVSNLRPMASHPHTAVSLVMELSLGMDSSLFLMASSLPLTASNLPPTVNSHPLMGSSHPLTVNNHPLTANNLLLTASNRLPTVSSRPHTDSSHPPTANSLPTDSSLPMGSPPTDSSLLPTVSPRVNTARTPTVALPPLLTNNDRTRVCNAREASTETALRPA